MDFSLCDCGNLFVSLHFNFSWPTMCKWHPNVPQEQCIEYGETGIISMIPGSESIPPGGSWIISFMPQPGTSSGGIQNGQPFTYFYHGSMPFVFDSDLNGYLSSQNGVPLSGQWGILYGVAPDSTALYMCQNNGGGGVLIDFRQNGFPCGTGTPLWTSVATAPSNFNCEGTAEVQVHTGTPPYTYYFSNGQSGSNPSLGSLCAGAYDVTIQDGNGATVVSTFIVSDNAIYSNGPAGGITDTLFTSPWQNCDLDFTSPIDSFQVVETYVTGQDTMYADWVVWQQGNPYTLTGEYPNLNSSSVILSMTIFCYEGRSEIGSYQMFTGLSNVTAQIEHSSLEEEFLNIYPNPSNGSFSLILNPKIESSIQAFNSNGALITSKHSNSRKYMTLELSKAGIYLVEVLTENGTRSVQKVVVQ